MDMTRHQRIYVIFSALIAIFAAWLGFGPPFSFPIAVAHQTPPPAINDCAIFPADNIWNTPVDTLPVDSNSAAYIATMGADATVHPDFGSGGWPPGSDLPIGIPCTIVPGSQPGVSVSPDRGQVNSAPVTPTATPPTATSTETETFYVATTGDDASGDGSASNPWATIDHALDSVPDGGTILVRPGTYTGLVRLDGTFATGVTVRSEPTPTRTPGGTTPLPPGGEYKLHVPVGFE